MISQLPKYLRQFSFQKKIGLIPRSYKSCVAVCGEGKEQATFFRRFKIETEIAIRTDIYTGAREIEIMRSS